MKITENINNSLEKAVIRIYEGFYNQIKESKDNSEEASIEDINMKVDIIMDALGLKDENEKDDSKTENSDVISSIDVQNVDSENITEKEETEEIDNEDDMTNAS